VKKKLTHIYVQSRNKHYNVVLCIFFNRQKKKKKITIVKNNIKQNECHERKVANRSYDDDCERTRSLAADTCASSATRLRSCLILLPVSKDSRRCHDFTRECGFESQTGRCGDCNLIQDISSNLKLKLFYYVE
jgi:hypothetical protein